MSLKPVLLYPTPDALKNVKFRLSQNSTKFDVVARFRENNSNGEIRFVIQDLENFWIFTKITILPFFIKLEFSWVLQASTGH